MPRGYRFFIVALGLAALFIAFGLGMYVVELNYPEQQRYQEYKSGKGNEGTATLTVTRDLAGSIMKRTPCHNPNSESESDLCAQWKAANAAEDSAFWTKWGFGVAIVGSSFLLWQIILTREAVKDTGNATLAMQRQNELADQGQRPRQGHARGHPAPDDPRPLRRAQADENRQNLRRLLQGGFHPRSPSVPGR